MFALDEFTSPVFGRFVIDPNRLIIPNGWEASPGVTAVSGVPYADVEHAIYKENPADANQALARRTVEEAATMIRAEIAKAPLPPLPTIIPDLAPIPSAGEAPVPSSIPTETVVPEPAPSP